MCVRPVYGLWCMGFGVHTALINLHPVSGSVEDGFKLSQHFQLASDRDRVVYLGAAM